MKITKFLNNSTEKRNRNAFKGGVYSLAMTAVVLAILVLVNVMVSALPSALTNYDISAAQLYSITSNTKVVVNALEKDVTIYWIVQADMEDDVIENLLNKYESLSDHIEIVKKNPDVFPTFAEQYTDGEVYNNSLVVECGEKYRYIGYDEIYLTEMDMTTYSYDMSFDGEGAITSAIDYVVNEEQPQIYMLEGHGEAELPDTFSNQLQKENIEIQNFSLLVTDTVPEEADCVMIYAPATDISEEEKNALSEYVENGGKLMVIAGPVEDGKLENLYSLLSNYGVESNAGIVVEEDRGYYAFQSPYILLPDIADSEITTPLINENYYVIVPIAQGMQVTGADEAVTELLTTSYTAFSKADGYYLTNYEREENDTDGPFSLAVSIDCMNDGQVVWVSSSYFLDDMYNSYSSGANVEFTLNAIASMIGESEAVSIRSKSLNYNYLTIDESTSSMLKVLMIGVFPLMYLGVGIYIILRRRKQNEAV